MKVLHSICQQIWKTAVATGMEKSKDFFNKIRDTKGTFHTKMGTIKDRNNMDLTEAEDIIEEVARIYRRTIQKRISQPR